MCVPVTCPWRNGPHVPHRQHLHVHIESCSHTAWLWKTRVWGEPVSIYAMTQLLFLCVRGLRPRQAEGLAQGRRTKITCWLSWLQSCLNLVDRIGGADTSQRAGRFVHKPATSLSSSCGLAVQRSRRYICCIFPCAKGKCLFLPFFYLNNDSTVIQDPRTRLMQTAERMLLKLLAHICYERSRGSYYINNRTFLFACLLV